MLARTKMPETFRALTNYSRAVQPMALPWAAKALDLPPPDRD
jgi:hypothetical protein